MLNLSKTAVYGMVLLGVGVLVGIIEGGIEPPVLRFVGSQGAIFALYGITFAHLAANQIARPYIHAWLALLLQAAIAWITILALEAAFGFTLPDSSDILSIIDWAVVICALLVGTRAGIWLRERPVARLGTPKGASDVQR